VAAALTIAPDGESITLTVKPLPPPKPSATAASEATQPPGADAATANPKTLNPADSGPPAGGSPTSTTTTAHIAEGGSVHGGQSAALDLLPPPQQASQRYWDISHGSGGVRSRLSLIIPCHHQAVRLVSLHATVHHAVEL
jgi:hypothetical protein